MYSAGLYETMLLSASCPDSTPHFIDITGTHSLSQSENYLIAEHLKRHT